MTVFAKPHAFPVPLVVGNGENKIDFTDLPSQGTITIYTAMGEEVTKLYIETIGQSVSWFLTNSNGRQVATGVYLYLINGDGENFTGKVVVIR